MRSSAAQLSLHKLEVFCEVAESGSVSLAAERLGLAQPVVTTHVQALSRKLGTPLTRKEGRRLVLTEEGERVFAWAREVTRQTRALERELEEKRSGLAGKAVVSASMTIGSYVLPRHLVAFRQTYPAAEISLGVSSPSTVLEQLRDGGCDVAFTILDPGRDLSGLSVRPVMKEALVLVGAPERFAPGTCLRADEIGALDFVTAAAGTARRLIEEQELLRHGIGRRRVAMEVGHAEAIKRSVRAGAGVALLFASSVEEELAAGTLTAIATPGADFAVPVYRLRRAEKTPSAFLDRLVAHLETALAG